MKMLYIYNNLKYLRKQLNLSQNSFAEKLNINVSNISRWENAKNGMSLDTAYTISQKIGIPLPDLIGKDLSKENINFNEIKNILNNL